MSAKSALADFVSQNRVLTRSVAIGRVLSVQGPAIVARLPSASCGDLCSIQCSNGTIIQAQVVSFNEDLIHLAPFCGTDGIGPGSQVVNYGHTPTITLKQDVRGSVIDAEGKLLQQPATPKEPINYKLPIYRDPPPPLERPIIKAPFFTGIRSIDAITPIGIGQRMAIIAPAGTGKSTLLSMIARNSDSDVNVIALVGERGREVNEFIQKCLDYHSLRKSVIVVATSDQSAAARSLAPLTATAVAEFYRDQGKNVLLLVDSLTRTARAIREMSLAGGELPVRHGYTARVYSELPRLLERSGPAKSGSITAFYTLLSSEADDEQDPLSAEIKSLLDGHIILSTELASEGVFPAVNLTRSISRLREKLLPQEALHEINTIISTITKLHEIKNALAMGSHLSSTMKQILKTVEPIRAFLRQNETEIVSPQQCATARTYLAKHCLSETLLEHS
ncbi:MAG: FliI/YscN family ATPase [Candidatus Dadabacteria bacterium]|nr:MAG: FliI/YscN family ATPase [Candidatus Dadabacteria bacterium]